MAVKFIVIGKTKEKYFLESEGEYLKRLKKFVSFDYLTLDSSKNETQASKVLQQEEKILLSRIKSTDFLILLDEKGMKFKNSTHFSQHLMNTLGQQKNVTFLVGGAFGFTDNIKKNGKRNVVSFTLDNATPLGANCFFGTTIQGIYNRPRWQIS
jgi:23S rRNA (pseudouridine1915-N3)-methyltransferase